MDDRANAIKARQELHEVCTSFGEIIKEGDEFYQVSRTALTAHYRYSTPQ